MDVVRHISFHWDRNALQDISQTDKLPDRKWRYTRSLRGKVCTMPSQVHLDKIQMDTDSGLQLQGDRNTLAHKHLLFRCRFFQGSSIRQSNFHLVLGACFRNRLFPGRSHHNLIRFYFPSRSCTFLQGKEWELVFQLHSSNQQDTATLFHHCRQELLMLHFGSSRIQRSIYTMEQTS